MRISRAIMGSCLAAAALLAWPDAALASGQSSASAALFDVVVLALWITSGLFLVLTCYDQLRAERICVWLLLHAVFALLSAILAGPPHGGTWSVAARLMLYATSLMALAGGALHVGALRARARLRRGLSLGQSSLQLIELDAELAVLSQDSSDQFDAIFERESQRIDDLRRPRLANFMRPARADADMPDRLRMQSRHLSTREQVPFGKAAELLGEKEELLVHLWPHMKRRHLLDIWCDAQVCLCGAAVGLILVHVFISLYY